MFRIKIINNNFNQKGGNETRQELNKEIIEKIRKLEGKNDIGISYKLTSGEPRYYLTYNNHLKRIYDEIFCTQKDSNIQIIKYSKFYRQYYVSRIFFLNMQYDEKTKEELDEKIFTEWNEIDITVLEKINKILNKIGDYDMITIKLLAKSINKMNERSYEYFNEDIKLIYNEMVNIYNIETEYREKYNRKLKKYCDQSVENNSIIQWTMWSKYYFVKYQELKLIEDSLKYIDSSFLLRILSELEKILNKLTKAQKKREDYTEKYYEMMNINMYISHQINWNYLILKKDGNDLYQVEWRKNKENESNKTRISRLNSIFKFYHNKLESIEDWEYSRLEKNLFIIIQKNYKTDYNVKKLNEFLDFELKKEERSQWISKKYELYVQGSMINQLKDDAFIFYCTRESNSIIQDRLKCDESNDARIIEYKNTLVRKKQAKKEIKEDIKRNDLLFFINKILGYISRGPDKNFIININPFTKDDFKDDINKYYKSLKIYYERLLEPLDILITKIKILKRKYDEFDKFWNDNFDDFLIDNRIFIEINLELLTSFKVSAEQQLSKIPDILDSEENQKKIDDCEKLFNIKINDNDCYDKKTLRTSFIRNMRKSHPDKGGNQEDFDEVQKCNKILEKKICS